MTTSILQIVPVWTDAGIELAHTLALDGISVKITHMSVGDANGTGYTTGGGVGQGMTALVNEIERTPIIGGIPLALNRSMQITSLIEGSTLAYDVREVGYWCNDTLVLVYAQVDPPIFKKTAGVGIALPLTLSLRRFQDLAPEAVIEVQNSPDLPAMIVEMLVHESKANPHPQYAGQAAISNLNTTLNGRIDDEVEMLVASIIAGLALKANINSPTFTGDPRSHTPALDAVNNQIITAEWVLGQGYAASNSYPKIIAQGNFMMYWHQVLEDSTNHIDYNYASNAAWNPAIPVTSIIGGIAVATKVPIPSAFDLTDLSKYSIFATAHVNFRTDYDGGYRVTDKTITPAITIDSGYLVFSWAELLVGLVDESLTNLDHYRVSWQVLQMR